MSGVDCVMQLVGEKQIEFPKLTPRDIIALTRQASEEQRVALIRDLDAVGATSDARLAALEKHRDREDTDGPLIDFLRKPHGQDAIFRASLAKLNGQAPTVDDLVIDRTDAFWLAAAICGFKKTDAATGRDDDDFERPTSGVTGSVTPA